MRRLTARDSFQASLSAKNLEDAWDRLLSQQGTLFQAADAHWWAYSFERPRFLRDRLLGADAGPMPAFEDVRDFWTDEFGDLEDEHRQFFALMLNLREQRALEADGVEPRPLAALVRRLELLEREIERVGEEIDEVDDPVARAERIDEHRFLHLARKRALRHLRVHLERLFARRWHAQLPPDVASDDRATVQALLERARDHEHALERLFDRPGPQARDPSPREVLAGVLETDREHLEGQRPGEPAAPAPRRGPRPPYPVVFLPATGRR